MDKRKVQRHVLHKNLNSPSTSRISPVMDAEDVFLCSASRNTSVSQRESNTNLLRKQINCSAPTDNIISDILNNSNDVKNLKRSNRSDDEFDEFPATKKITSQQRMVDAKKNIGSSPTVNPIVNAVGIELKSSQITETKGNILRANLKTRNNDYRHITLSNKENNHTEKNYFNYFLNKVGVVDNNDDCYMINDDPVIIVKRMQQLLGSVNFNLNKLVQEWNNLVVNKTFLEQCLGPTNIVNCDEGICSSSTDQAMRYTKSISLAKILLQVPALQTSILNSLIQKLNETVVAIDKMEDVPWIYQLLQQFRFIEIIHEPELLTMKLEELLETSPIWFQRELITFLPDIVIDSQHENIAEILCRLMEVHNDLTNIILDCITNLSLSKGYQDELREKMLNTLQYNCHIDKIPAIIRFCLNDCNTIDSCQNVLHVIRTLELNPLNGENSNEYYTNQMLIVNAMRISIILTSDMANAAISITTGTENGPKSFDIIILLLVYDCTKKKKKADAILRQHVKNGYYDSKLLNAFYDNYKLVTIDLQPIALRMSSNLLKSDDPMLIDFSSEWFRRQFIAHNHLIHKQREIVEKLILLMGSDNHTAKNALSILCRMTKNEEEKKYLQAHCNHLKILIEKVEKFQLVETMVLNDLLHALCTNSNTVSDSLRDDLFILLQKQLSCRSDSMIKCKGVAGAVMAVKHLASNPTCCKMAKIILQKVLKGIKDCPRSQGFFYDKIGSVISDSQDINKEFLKYMTEIFKDEFIKTFMIDLSNYSGEFEPTFGLNNSNENSEILIIHFGQSKYGGAVAPALLRLMGICFTQIDNNDVEPISALLGTAVLLPKDLNFPDPQTLDYLFHCINWFRELINVFVTQSDVVLQKQVYERLNNIIDLQSELSHLLTLAESRYQPPPCFFHSCPNEFPALKQVEKKIIKKSKQRPLGTVGGPTPTTEKCGTLQENREKWEIATLLSTKNTMYFRRLDAKILNLVDVNITSNVPSSLSQSIQKGYITTRQLCFIIKEILAVFEDVTAANEQFLQDLICLLPKICSKLQITVHKLELEENNHNDDDNNNQNRQAIKLIFEFLTTTFRWKQFNNPIYNTMLRDGLRILAAQVDESNMTVSSCKKLVSESYRYFESLTHVATQISIAFALVEVCQTLMKHSATFTQHHQGKQAKMAYGFLCLEWPDDRYTSITYKSAVIGLLKNWMDHEPNPLITVTSVLEWLPNQVEKIEKPHEKLIQMPSINRTNIHHLILKIFNGLIKGMKISLALASTDMKKIEVWRNVAENIQGIVVVCKIITTRNTLMVYLRYMPLVLQQIHISGMPLLERTLRYRTEEVTGILKMMQVGTRYLNTVCNHSTEKKDLVLTKLVPTAKKILEKLIYSVKCILISNNCSTAFWMGNLVNKNLDGQEILSQTSSSTDADYSSAQDAHTSHDNSDNNGVNDILDDGSLSELLDNDQGISEVDDEDDDNESKQGNAIDVSTIVDE